jgi:hypothetical protein
LEGVDPPVTELAGCVERERERGRHLGAGIRGQVSGVRIEEFGGFTSDGVVSEI